MKNLFLKNKLVQKIALSLLLLSFLFFSLNFFYNQNRVILAEEEEVEEEEEYEKLKCGREIPVGEAMEKTGELLEELLLHLDSIYENAYYQIQATEEMIGLTEECDTNKCQPVTCGSYTEDIDCLPCRNPVNPDPITGGCIEWSVCSQTLCHSPSPCTSSWEGRACPQDKIDNAFKKVSDYYDKIENAKKEIWALINGTDNGVDKRESLCDKLNEDIRTPIEKGLCIGCPVIENPLCPKITKIEAIRRKLNLSRGEFDKCYISCADEEKVSRGDITGKYLFSCPIVSEEDWPRYTKTEEEVEGEKMPVCTSLHNNWFCCLDVP